MVEATLVASAAAPGDAPNAIYDAAKLATKVASIDNGVYYHVEAPDNVSLPVLHLWGNASERGFAQGRLLGDEILEFVNNDLDNFYKSEVDQIPLGLLPVWLQKAIKGLLKTAAPTAFNLALDWVYSQQKDFIGASAADVWQEAAGIASGVCFNRTTAECDVEKLTKTLHRVNMLPELIQMQCSMMGAWGAATPDGKLVQLRSLDFGGGPFADRNILIVNHPTDSPNGFAVLSFPGFVGAVTGFSEKISLSEKVDDVTGASRPAGTYKGQAVSMVIRDIIQFSETKEQAIQIAQAANRTWSVWLGVGDEHSQQFRAMLYEEASATPYDDTTLPSLTNQTAIKDVAYIDKHPQPSPHPDMPQLVKRFYGNLTARNVVQYIPRLMDSGDVHVAVYDWGAKKVYLAMGITNSSGGYVRKACDSPYLEFDMDALWAEPRPAASAHTL